MSFLDTTEFVTIRAYAIVQRGAGLVEIYSENYTPKYQSISQVFPLRTNVQTYGIITGILGTRLVFISQRDNNGSIVLYNPASVSGLAIGDEVIVSGTIVEFKGLVEFSGGATITKVSSSNTLPSSIELGTELLSFTPTNQSKRYSIKGLEVMSKISREITLSDGVNQIVVKNDDTSNVDLTNHLNSFSVGSLVDLVDIHLAWYDNPMFYITDTSQIVSTTDNAIIIDKIVAKLDSLYHGKEFNMGSTFTPISSLFGVTLNWTLPNDLIEEGKLKSVTSDEQATLTASYTVGTNQSHSVEITVKFIESQVDPVLFVTYDFANYTGNSSSTAFTDTGLLNALKLVDIGTDYLTSVTNLARVYPGNSSSGTYQTNKLIKLGSSGTPASSFTLNFNNANIVKVIIYVEPWTTSTASTFTINGNTKNVGASAGSFLTYEFDESTNILNFSSNQRGFIFKIELYRNPS